MMLPLSLMRSCSSSMMRCTLLACFCSALDAHKMASSSHLMAVCCSATVGPVMMFMLLTAIPALLGVCKLQRWRLCAVAARANRPGAHILNPHSFVAHFSPLLLSFEFQFET